MLGGTGTFVSLTLELTKCVDRRGLWSQEALAKFYEDHGYPGVKCGRPSQWAGKYLKWLVGNP